MIDAVLDWIARVGARRHDTDRVIRLTRIRIQVADQTVAAQRREAVGVNPIYDRIVRRRADQ